MRMFRGLTTVAVGLLLAAGSVAGAADTVSGKVDITSKSIAAGIGVQWGEGTLTLNDGSTHKFTLKGLSVADVGISSVSASGTVYNLDPKNLKQFNGTYVSGQAGAAAAGGGAGIVMRNQEGVRIELSATQAGAKLTLAVEGVTLQLK